MKRTIIVLILIVVLGSAGYIGWALNELLTKPEVVVAETIKEVPVEHIVTVQVPVEVIKEKVVYLDRPVEKIIEKPAIVPLKALEGVDLDRMYYMACLGEYSHFNLVEAYGENYRQLPGIPTEGEWVKFYQVSKAVIREYQADDGLPKE